MPMSTIHFLKIAPLLLAGLVTPALASASDGPLAPFKDELFSAQTVLESRDGGDFKIIDYDEMRDINGRDREPERRVKSDYVDTSVRSQQVNETLGFGPLKLPVTRVGPANNGRFTVIFIHGRGGDRRLGANDFSFGGNFNRLKNLAVRNGGTYYVPSVPSFDSSGVAAIAALVDHAAKRAPGRPVILACASMGSFICSGISRDKQAVSQLAGMAILGGAPDPDYAGTPAYARKLPLFMTHGSADKVYKSGDQEALYSRWRKAGYPVRLTVFQTGGHGTPVRMSDWREMLNWLLTRT
ncbi:alpha/beta fold hydrolase [Rhizobium sp. RU36D]|uniref:alpha/beta fold hydrolase n=1 Tax=Rhizobium sp. RU36D TaxID=1907415 RepID=UPI0009D7AF84|nr:alpha/beta fold hydrolase [Rhizobium sp. RU36D]SMC68661.1 Predicted esterase [Rhizobium sp. RU36D]